MMDHRSPSLMNFRVGSISNLYPLLAIMGFRDGEVVLLAIDIIPGLVEENSQLFCGAFLSVSTNAAPSSGRPGVRSSTRILPP